MKKNRSVVIISETRKRNVYINGTYHPVKYDLKSISLLTKLCLTFILPGEAIEIIVSFIKNKNEQLSGRFWLVIKISHPLQPIRFDKSKHFITRKWSHTCKKQGPRFPLDLGGQCLDNLPGSSCPRILQTASINTNNRVKVSSSQYGILYPVSCPQCLLHFFQDNICKSFKLMRNHKHTHATYSPVRKKDIIRTAVDMFDDDN